MQPTSPASSKQAATTGDGFGVQAAHYKDRIVTYFCEQVPVPFMVISQVALALLTLGVGIAGSGLSFVGGLASIGLAAYATINWTNDPNKTRAKTISLIETSISTHGVFYFVSQAAILSSHASVIALMILGIYCYRNYEFYIK